MLLGAMNNPMIDIVEEINRFSDLGFDFIDLTIEPEETYSATIDIKKIIKALNNKNMGAIGHTAWYIPIASPFPDFRELAIKELERCMRVCRDIGITKMNLHPHIKAPLHDEKWVIAQNIDALSRLVNLGKKLGIKIVLENMPHFSRVAQLKPILDAVPEALLLLDIGHANLDTPYNRSEELLAHFGDRLGHVHVSDNRGGKEDEHLPIGVGTINWEKKIRLLKNIGYDGTITLEVFADNDEYLLTSRKKIAQLWETIESGTIRAESEHDLAIDIETYNR